MSSFQKLVFILLLVFLIAARSQNLNQNPNPSNENINPLKVFLVTPTNIEHAPDTMILTGYFSFY